jgi:hypothetical protein
MEKLPIFEIAKYEFTHFALTTLKNEMAIHAIEYRLNVITEAINSLIDKDSSVDLDTFKTTFLKELAELLNQKTEFEFSNSLFELLGTERADLKANVSLLELQVQSLTQRVSKMESALGHKKIQEIEKSNSLDLPG